MKTSRLLCYAAGFFLVSFILMALAYFWTGGRRLCVHCNKKTLGWLDYPIIANSAFMKQIKSSICTFCGKSGINKAFKVVYSF